MWHFETSSPSSSCHLRDHFSKSVWRFKKGKSDKDDTSQHQETNKWHEKQTRTRQRENYHYTTTLMMWQGICIIQFSSGKGLLIILHWEKEKAWRYDLKTTSHFIQTDRRHVRKQYSCLRVSLKGNAPVALDTTLTSALRVYTLDNFRLHSEPSATDRVSVIFRETWIPGDQPSWQKEILG